MGDAIGDGIRRLYDSSRELGPTSLNRDRVDNEEFRALSCHRPRIIYDVQTERRLDNVDADNDWRLPDGPEITSNCHRKRHRRRIFVRSVSSPRMEPTTSSDAPSKKDQRSHSRYGHRKNDIHIQCIAPIR